ncbi:MAG: TspO/MBR family protein [Patescibacteria group bacterium]|nr:TspO/MBR family protein [bacterium]MDZ4240879.1 TspO/MBR family protein [Patescibacteria group bacterium]
MKVISLIVFILIAYAAGALGAQPVAESIDTWYAELVKPAWNPPSFVFGPVWFVLYTLMGIAVWRVWNRRYSNPLSENAFIFYAMQLTLNAAWSPLFFGLHSPFLAFLDISVLAFLVATTTAIFWRIDKTAGKLLVPYFCWTVFALVLNLSIWQLNA